MARAHSRWTRRRSATVIITAPGEAIAIDGREFRRLTEEIESLRDAIGAMAAARSLPSE